MRAMLEISRLWQTGFAQGYDESSSYAEFRDTQDADQPLARRISDPAGGRRSEVRGQGRVDKHSTLKPQPPTLRIALLTGGGDKPYALGIAAALTSEGISVDFIGSDDLEVPELLTNPRINFLNLRGNQRPDASSFSKAKRVLNYYKQLISYATTAQPKLFHLLWNNKFEFFDRTLLMLYYRLLGKRVVLTVHNVNAGKRDAIDGGVNRLTLWIQYHLADHLFVHTDKMKRELIEAFGVRE